MGDRSESGVARRERYTPDGHQLVLPRVLADEISALAEVGHREEVCGLLLGTQEDSICEVVAVRRAVNLDRDRAHDRYEIDPLELLAAEREARARQLEIVGVWHSHPDRPAVPSATDLAAAWPGWSYVIVSVAAGRAGELRSWRLHTSRFVEETVRCRVESDH